MFGLPLALIENISNLRKRGQYRLENVFSSKGKGFTLPRSWNRSCCLCITIAIISMILGYYLLVLYKKQPPSLYWIDGITLIKDSAIEADKGMVIFVHFMNLSHWRTRWFSSLFECLVRSPHLVAPTSKWIILICDCRSRHITMPKLCFEFLEFLETLVEH